MAQKAKCLTRKINQRTKSNAQKKEYEDKLCGENVPGKVIKKLEFIENGLRFQIFLSLFSSEIEDNFFHIS